MDVNSGGHWPLLQKEMLKNRILSTLKFFDLQGYPLTVLELGNFLLPEIEDLNNLVDENWEIKKSLPTLEARKISLAEIVNCLEAECAQETENLLGFYCLRGRVQIIQERWENYLFTIGREKRINRFVKYLKYLPFIRGAAVGGSQAMGQQNQNSDIDLFVITDLEFLGLARVFLTIFFQIFGVRRHGKKIANRFCLNHYLAKGESSFAGRDLYNAMEYLRFRPKVYSQNINNFLVVEFGWIKYFFPNAREPKLSDFQTEKQPGLQKFLEKIFRNKAGRKIEKWLCTLQLAKIRRGNNFVVATNLEMAFHSLGRKRELIGRFIAD